MTEEAAGKIAARLREYGLEPQSFDVYHAELKTMLDFDVLLLGCPTWYVGELQDDWDNRFSELDSLDLRGKRVALFGTGDQICYSDTFQDALGILGEKCRERGAMLIGSWPTDGYDFDDSRGVEDGAFLGLALDDDNQPELTEDRVKRWTRQLVDELNIEAVAA